MPWSAASDVTGSGNVLEAADLGLTGGAFDGQVIGDLHSQPGTGGANPGFFQPNGQTR